MDRNFSAPWHRASYERLMRERLPLLLAENLPLAGYRVASETQTSCRVEIELESGAAVIALSFPDLPQPDADGLFWLAGQPYVVIPLASCEELDQASIACVGEQLEDWLRARLGRAPAGLALDESLARSLLPLEDLFAAFLREKAQRLDDTNWCSRQTHLRRILITNRQRVIAPGQMGRVDPFETPEGPNIGRVFSIAAGAEIRAGQLVVIGAGQPGGCESNPLACLGSTSLMVPLMEYNDANRLLMGVNMLRQALPPERYGHQPEAALVQTGFEPDDAANFWTGRNLLTAFISLGEATTADGIVLSQSAARRLGYPAVAAAGDKLANRHGIKGVISQVLPDAEMPCLADGTPLELVYSFHSLHARMTFSLVLEAVLGRLARAEGRPVIAPPFAGPRREEIRARLAAAGLPESGMETLTGGRSGQPLPYPSTVGWVYWLRLMQRAEPQLQYTAGQETGAHNTARQAVMGDMEIDLLRSLGAHHNAREALGPRAARWRAPGEGASRLEEPAQASGPQADRSAQPTAWFLALNERLRAAGIQAELRQGRLYFDLCEPGGEVLRLAQPVTHPWLPEGWLEAVGSLPGSAQHVQAGLEELRQLRDANDRLARLARSQAPERLLQDARRQVSVLAEAYLNALLSPAAMRIDEAQCFSAQGVAAPALGQRYDQLGLPEEVAWAWYGGRITPEVGQAAVTARTPAAAEALDRTLQDTWVLAVRGPAATSTSLLAFHPLRVAGSAIRLPALALDLLGADFDGDVLSLYLPLSAAAQAEAGQKLSLAAHLDRDPHLLRQALPRSDAQWGLAWLSLAAEGQRAIETIIGSAALEHSPQKSTGLFTRDSLAAVIEPLLARLGAQQTLEMLQALSTLGYDAVARSGASLSPFAGEWLKRPAAPENRDRQAWQNYCEQWNEVVLAGQDYQDPQLGPQWLAAKAHPRGRRGLPALVGPWYPVEDENGATVIGRHGVAEGRPAVELLATLNGARNGLAHLAQEQERLMQPGLAYGDNEPLSLLVRARRARHPGVIFARAAADAAFDPLEDSEARLLAGI
jgi:hypothetical protein